jgi:hypothetical protein
MNARARVVSELDGMSEPLVAEVLDFCLFLKSRHRRVSEETLLTEPLIAREWLTPEEDEAWSAL